MCKPSESHKGGRGGRGEGSWGEGVGRHGNNMPLIHSFHCEGEKIMIKSSPRCCDCFGN